MVCERRLTSWKQGQNGIAISPDISQKIVADFSEENVPIRYSAIRHRPFVSLPSHTTYEVIRQTQEKRENPTYSNPCFQFLVDAELADNQQAQQAIRSHNGPILLLRRTQPDKDFRRSVDAYSHDYHESTIALTHVKLSEQLDKIIQKRRRGASSEYPQQTEEVLAEKILTLAAKSMKFYPVTNDPEVIKAFEALNTISDKHELEYNLIMSSQSILRSLNVVSALIVLTGIFSQSPLQEFTTFAGTRGSATAAVWGGDMLTQLMHKANEVASDLRYHAGQVIDWKELRKRPVGYIREKWKELTKKTHSVRQERKQKRESKRKENGNITQDKQFRRRQIVYRMGLSLFLLVGDFLFAGGSLKLLSIAPIAMQSVNTVYKYFEKVRQIKNKNIVLTKNEYKKLTQNVGGIFTKIFQKFSYESLKAQRHLIAISETIANKMILSSLLGTVASSALGLSGGLDALVQAKIITRELADLFLGTIVENGFAFLAGLRFLFKSPYAIFLNKYKTPQKK